MNDPLFHSNPIAYILGAIFLGAICGLLPFFMARKKGRLRLGIFALVCCIVAGVIAGLLLAVPIAALFSVAIAFAKNEQPHANDLQGMSVDARNDVKQKWLYFHNTIHLKEGVPLALKIDLFAAPVQQFFQNKYPLLLIGSSEIFWLTIFTAILESGTHPKDEVNAAIRELQTKYAKN